MTSAVRAYIDQLSRDPLRDDLRVTPGGRVVGRFLRCEIDSAFQPIARLTPVPGEPTVTAFQALARVHAETGNALSPSDLFSLAASDDDLVLLDRRCRIVHTLNYYASAAPAADLLLNVHERLLSAVEVDHGRAFRRVLESLAVQSRRVLIALPLLTPKSLDRHCDVLASYRLNGFRVAVTADQPAVLQALLARIRADVVRVDASRLSEPGWAEAFDAGRTAGAEVHITRIEGEPERGRAQALGATHWQGWLLARPAPLASEPGLATAQGL